MSAHQKKTLNRSTRSTQLQRKSSCACGGGCPSCKADSESHNPSKLQKKLSIGASNGPLEQEADRVADQVMATSSHSAVSDSPPHVQRFTRHATEALSNSAPASVDRVIAGSGKPLEASMQNDMGQRFGNDFSDVRVHSGAAAEHSARDVNANAYTVGNNIVFGAGQYTPTTHQGKRLLAHELTHVVQQSKGGPNVLSRQPADGEDEVFKAMMEMPQWQRDQMQGRTDTFNNIKNFQDPVLTPKPQPAPAQDAGCHKDPYARSGSASTCSGGHHKKEDDAARATQKAMQQPEADFNRLENLQRAKFDRLNAAYFEWQRTGKFTHRNEFSPYEIEKDNLFDVKTRWNLSMQAHGVDPNNLESVQFDEHYFVSKGEYQVELYSREAQYKKDFKACKKDRGMKWPKLSRKHPEYIDCQNRVDAKYYPRGADWQDKARRAVYADMQVGMPAVTDNGFIASAGFHIAHEWLGWDTDKSAAFSGALSTLGGLAKAKMQQTISTRNSNQNTAPPQAMSPPPANVATAPDKKPIPAPGAPPQVVAQTPSIPPLITVPRQMDLSQKLQLPPATTPSKAPTKVMPPIPAAILSPPAVKPTKPSVVGTPGITISKVVAKPVTPDDVRKLVVNAEAPQALKSADFSKVQLAPGQDALYIIRDTADGSVLKVGKTSESAAVGRFRVYKNAEKLEGRILQIEVYPLKPSTKKAETFEKALRKKMEADGHAMPWDNTGGRLKRPGFGTPGEGARTPSVTMEKLKELLTLHKGNRKEVGKALGIHHRTVGMWAQAYGLKTSDFK